MKKVTLLFAIIIASASIAFAQTSTYVLLRHAEKDTSAKGSTMMTADPALSKEGEQRAMHLIEALKKYTPDIIYSTNYVRTKSTVTPLAKKFDKQIVVYSPKDLKAFAEELLLQKGKTIVVAGHSNTTPALVNQLIKEEKYKALDESIYNQIFIVTVDGDKTDVKILTY